jgi:hypothetical protein
MNTITLIVEHATAGGKVLPHMLDTDGKVIEAHVDGEKKAPKWPEFSRWCRWLMDNAFEPTGFKWISKAGPGYRRRKCTYTRNGKPPETKLVKLVHKVIDRWPDLETRAYRAAELVRRGRVTRSADGSFNVKSQSNPRGSYRVDSEAGTCTCPDYPKAPQVNGRPMCKHRMAVLMLLKLEEARIPAEETQAPSPPTPHSITPQRKAQLQDLQHQAALAGQPMVLVT